MKKMLFYKSLPTFKNISINSDDSLKHINDDYLNVFVKPTCVIIKAVVYTSTSMIMII